MIDDFRRVVDSNLGSWNALGSGSKLQLLQGLGRAWISLATPSSAAPTRSHLLPVPKRAEFLLVTFCCLKMPNADRDISAAVDIICASVFERIVFASFCPNPSIDGLEAMQRSGNDDSSKASILAVAHLLDSLLFAGGGFANSISSSIQEHIRKALDTKGDQANTATSSSGFSNVIKFFGSELVCMEASRDKSLKVLLGGSNAGSGGNRFLMLRRAVAEAVMAAAAPQDLETVLLQCHGGTVSTAALGNLLHVSCALTDGARLISSGGGAVAASLEQFWCDKLRPAFTNVMSTSCLPKDKEIGPDELLDAALGGPVMECVSRLPLLLRDGCFRLMLTAVGQLSAPAMLVAAKVLDTFVRRQRRSRVRGGGRADVYPEALIELVRCACSNEQDRQVFEHEYLRLSAWRLLASSASGHDRKNGGDAAETASWQLLEQRCSISKNCLHRLRTMIGVKLGANVTEDTEQSSSPETALLICGAVDASGILTPPECFVRAVPLEYFSVLASPFENVAGIPKALLSWPIGSTHDQSTEAKLLLRSLSSFSPEKYHQRKFSWGSQALLAAEVEIFWEDANKRRHSSMQLMCIPHVHLLQALCDTAKALITVDELHSALSATSRPDRLAVTEGLAASAPFLMPCQPTTAATTAGGRLFRTCAAQSQSFLAGFDGVLGEVGTLAFRRGAAAKKSSSSSATSAAVVSKSDLLRSEAAIVRYLKKRDGADFAQLCDDVQEMLQLSGGAVDRTAVKNAVDSLVGKEIVELLNDGSFKYKP